MGIDTLFYLLYRLIHSFTGLITGEGPLAFWKTETFATVLWWYKLFAGIVSTILFCALVYVAYKMITLSMKVKEGEGNVLEQTKTTHALSPGEERWVRITEKLNSEREADWKLAILEADAILEDIVGTMGLPGMSMGDKLKNVERSDFLTLESAWEAHKARNRIAHDTDGVPLSHREAQRIIALYENVFREFKYL